TLTPPVTLFTFGTQSTLKVDCCLLLRPSRLFRYNSPLLIPAGASLVLRIFCSAPRLIAATSQNPFPATSLAPSLGLLLERLLSTWLAQRPLHAHGVTSTSEASWFGEREGDIGDREEESAGAAVDVRFALTGTGCVGRPVNLVGTKGTLGTGKRKVLAPRWMCASSSRRWAAWGGR